MWKTERIPDACENDARIRKVLSALGARPKRDRKDQWAANCPAHGGDSWKLDITLTPDAVFLLTCRSRGCSCNDICRAAGLHPADLFPPGRNNGGSRPASLPRPPLLPLSPTATAPQPTARRANPSPDFARDHRALVESPAVMAFLAKSYLPGCAMDDVTGVPWGCMKDLVFPDGTVHDAIIYFSDYSDAVTAKSLDRNAKGKRWSMYLAGDASTLWEVFGDAEDDTAALCGGQEKAWAVRCCTGMNAFSLNGEGMNLKESHLAQLRERGAKRVIVINDADETGRRGTERSVQALEAAGFETAALVWEDGLKEGFDVNDLVLRDGREGLKRFVLGAPFLHPFDRHPWSKNILTLSQCEDAMPRYLVKGIVNRDTVNVWCGDFGSLKSMLSMDLAAAVCRGRPWLEGAGQEGFRTKKCNVGILSKDNPTSTTKARACAFRKKYALGNDELIILNHPAIDLAAHPEQAAALRLWADRYNLSLLILDSLQNVHTAEERTEEAGRVLQTLRERFNGTGVGIIILHHVNKQGTQRGSNSIPGQADNVVMVVRGRDEWRNIVSLGFDKVRDGPDDGEKIYAEWYYTARTEYDEDGEAVEALDTAWFERAEKPEKFAESSPVETGRSGERRVMECLLENPGGVNQKTIAELCGMDVKTVKGLLRRLEDDGQAAGRQGGYHQGIIWSPLRQAL